MRKRIPRFIRPLLAAGFAMSLFASLSASTAAGQSASRTLRNLQAAYNSEMNAHSRYLAYAEKTDMEGYRAVAALFRAVARAEEVHQVNHAAVIRAMGAIPLGLTEFPIVGPTRENLLAAMNTGKADQRDTMYRGFIEQANDENNSRAARTFDMARKAEAQHFNLFSHALTNFENGWEIAPAYYVCTVCGYAVSEPVVNKCVSCAGPAEKYEPVG